MKNVVIFGVSTLARLAYIYLTEDSPYDVRAFTVHKDYLREDNFMGVDVVPFEQIEQLYPPDRFAMFVPIGYKRVNHARAEIYTQCKTKGYELIRYMSSHLVHWNHIEIGDNCFIYGTTIIQPFTIIGNNTIIGSANIAHDCIIEDHCYIASHAVIAGNVHVGHHTFIGVNATIKDGVTIAPECIIGAGAVILKNTEQGKVYPGQNAQAASILSSELKSFQ